MSAARWAEAFFAGAPYRWGGITTWGVDCSGLVQAAYRVRGIRLPRDSAQQAEAVWLRETFAGARRVERLPAGGPAGRRG
jgi:hypothetical protein